MITRGTSKVQLLNVSFRKVITALATFLLIVAIYQVQHGRKTRLADVTAIRRSLGHESNDFDIVTKRNRRLQYVPGNMEHEKAAIATVVSNLDRDVDDFCIALKALAFLHGDTLDRPRTPVLAFHEDLSVDQKTILRSCTDRTIIFVDLLFQQFPTDFDRFKEESESTKVPFQPVEGRPTWGYHQMIRFWTTGIWRHPAIEPYDTIMRFDSDMCFIESDPMLPHLAGPQKVYHSYFGGAEMQPEFVEGLYDFAVDYMKRENIVPANPEMWEIIEKVKSQKQTLPLFQTSLEVSRRSFMQRKDVDKWHSSLTEREPFGVFRHRWSDGVTRFITMAMFAQPGSVQINREQDFYFVIHGSCHRGDLDYLATSAFKRYAKNFLGLSLFRDTLQKGQGKIAW